MYNIFILESIVRLLTCVSNKTKVLPPVFFFFLFFLIPSPWILHEISVHPTFYKITFIVTFITFLKNFLKEKLNSCKWFLILFVSGSIISYALFWYEKWYNDLFEPYLWNHFFFFFLECPHCLNYTYSEISCWLIFLSSTHTGVIG